ncbi:hypothetical protein QR680_005243 [Steinernema hermaphroditum]|uniref:Uncharacterized protein n=1 Tax=Steinernema hermaphroditum TaxID=289476 RepID=A0AA39HRA7_9BILA|nr:hypothetical protein QR680_005243 [Steinernema hermaphroditum]
MASPTSVRNPKDRFHCFPPSLPAFYVNSSFAALTRLKNLESGQIQVILGRSRVRPSGKKESKDEENTGTINTKLSQDSLSGGMFAPATAMPIYTTCTAGISATRPTCHFEFGREEEFGSGIEVGCLEDSFATFEIKPKFSNASLSRSKIKRTVSSLSGHECTHSKQQENSVCIVEARQIEIDFASLTASEFFVQIEAPNGESSGLLDFCGYGKTMNFSPKKEGCGHGIWTFKILQGPKLTLVHEETMYLDGVGSLFFTVGDDLRARLTSQEFLRLPSASRCCGRQRQILEN